MWKYHTKQAKFTYVEYHSIHNSVISGYIVDVIHGVHILPFPYPLTAYRVISSTRSDMFFISTLGSIIYSIYRWDRDVAYTRDAPPSTWQLIYSIYSGEVEL